MNRNSEIILMLCSGLDENLKYKSYKPSEWTKLAELLRQVDLQPYHLARMSYSELKSLNMDNTEINRIQYLLNRNESLTFELEKYKNMGISIVTRADATYPKALKSNLGRSCPPLFYYTGNLKLAEQKCIGFTGSRNVNSNDIIFTKKVTSTINSLGYAVVSGGAKGVDTISVQTSIQNGNNAIIYLADSMVKKIRDRQTISNIQNGSLLLFSSVKPDLDFTTATAMMRNRYIYAQSVGTVVVRSNYKKGGTWNGAIDSLKHKITPVFCWNNLEYKGNQELIKLKAIPIDDTWNGNISSYYPPQDDEPIQMTLFD